MKNESANDSVIITSTFECLWDGVKKPGLYCKCLEMASWLEKPRNTQKQQQKYYKQKTNKKPKTYPKNWQEKENNCRVAED